MGDDVNEAGEPVELFGTLELVLSEANSTKYTVRYGVLEIGIW